MAFNFMIPLRIAQGFLAVLALALNAYVASWYNLGTESPSPSEINFLIFAGIWTAVVVIPYLTVSPRFFPSAAHRFAILAAEAVTMVFWFAGFISTALFLAGLKICRGQVCMAARAGVAMAAFEWILFSSTTIMAIIYVFRTRGSTTSRTAKAMETNASVI